MPMSFGHSQYRVADQVLVCRACNKPNGCVVDPTSPQGAYMTGIP